MLEPEIRQHQRAVEGMVPQQPGMILDLNDMARMRGILTLKDEKHMRQRGRLQLANGASRDPGDPSAMNEELATAAWTLPSIMHPTIAMGRMLGPETQRTGR